MPTSTIFIGLKKQTKQSEKRRWQSKEKRKLEGGGGGEGEGGWLDSQKPKDRMCSVSPIRSPDYLWKVPYVDLGFILSFFSSLHFLSLSYSYLFFSFSILFTLCVCLSMCMCVCVYACEGGSNWRPERARRGTFVPTLSTFHAQ